MTNLTRDQVMSVLNKVCRYFYDQPNELLQARAAVSALYDEVEKWKRLKSEGDYREIALSDANSMLLADVEWWHGELAFMERSDADPKALAVAKHIRKRMAERTGEKP